MNSNRNKSLLMCLLLSVLITAIGCVSSHLTIGTVKAPKDYEDVKIYTRPLSEYEVIAVVRASSKYSLTVNDQMELDVALSRLKKEAAKLGANGIILQRIGNQPVSTIGTRVINEDCSINESFMTRLAYFDADVENDLLGIAIHVPKESLISTENKEYLSSERHLLSVKDDENSHERWSKIGDVRSGGQVYIDSQTISGLSANIIRLWTKIIRNDAEFLDLMEFDCSKNKFRVLESNQKHNVNFLQNSNEWRYIFPDSTYELVYESVCTKRTITQIN